MYWWHWGTFSVFFYLIHIFLSMTKSVSDTCSYILFKLSRSALIKHSCQQKINWNVKEYVKLNAWKATSSFQEKKLNHISQLFLPWRGLVSLIFTSQNTNQSSLFYLFSYKFYINSESQKCEIQRRWRLATVLICCLVSSFQLVAISWATLIASKDAPESPLPVNPTAYNPAFPFHPFGNGFFSIPTSAKSFSCISINQPPNNVLVFIKLPLAINTGIMVL